MRCSTDLCGFGNGFAKNFELDVSVRRVEGDRHGEAACRGRNCMQTFCAATAANGRWSLGQKILEALARSGCSVIGYFGKLRGKRVQAGRPSLTTINPNATLANVFGDDLDLSEVKEDTRHSVLLFHNSSDLGWHVAAGNS